MHRKLHLTEIAFPTGKAELALSKTREVRFSFECNCNEKIRISHNNIIFIYAHISRYVYIHILHNISFDLFSLFLVFVIFYFLYFDMILRIHIPVASDRLLNDIRCYKVHVSIIVTIHTMQIRFNSIGIPSR